MTPVLWIVLLVAAQRIAELLYAQRNTRALLARGAYEVAPEQHAFFVALHAAWLAAVAWFGLNAAVNWWLIGVFVVLQAARIWVIGTLGPYWTTRIITLPGAPLVRSGPYRFVRHPNYVIVALEVAVLPLAFGEWPVALAFTVLNALLVAWRIGAEERALAGRPLR